MHNLSYVVILLSNNDYKFKTGTFLGICRNCKFADIAEEIATKNTKKLQEMQNVACLLQHIIILLYISELILL